MVARADGIVRGVEKEDETEEGMTPRRLIDVETLKTGAALLDDYRAAVKKMIQWRIDETQHLWKDWAALYAGDIMTALTAYAALEEIVDRTWVTELVWMGDPGRWELLTDTDQTGEEEGHWVGEDLHTVLRAAASDFTAADEMEGR